MKKIFLILAVLGFIIPTYLVIVESIESGNILLYSKPIETINKMFANRVASIFSIDLLFGVFVFFIWTYIDWTKELKRLFFIWGVTLLFGFASGFPLYLYFRHDSTPN